MRSQPVLPATQDNIAQAQRFVLQKWIERWHERNPDRPARTACGWDREPIDLSGSCKFSSMFAQRIFGGELRGNYDHQYVELPDGSVLDLNRDALDVQALANPHWHDPKFWGNPDHRESMRSCEPRVDIWVKEFIALTSDATRLIERDPIQQAFIDTAGDSHPYRPSHFARSQPSDALWLRT